MKKRIVLILAATLVLSTVFSSTIFGANATMNLEEAKEYLLSYEELGITDEGLGYRTTISFVSEEAFEYLARFLAENGVEVFWKTVNAGIKQVVDSWAAYDAANHERTMQKQDAYRRGNKMEYNKIK